MSSSSPVDVAPSIPASTPVLGRGPTAYGALKEQLDMEEQLVQNKPPRFPFLHRHRRGVFFLSFLTVLVFVLLLLYGLRVFTNGRVDLSSTAAPTYVTKLNMSPRYQWNENDGYCGEVSFITIGLYFGQYVSQYTLRSIASNNTGQSSSDSQLLIGVNDYWTANQLKLKPIVWTGPLSIDSFMLWMKQNIVAGNPVIMGVFENSSVFGQKPDPDYDHICPVYGWGSNSPLTDNTYHSDDTIYYYDNGLYTPDGNPIYYMSSALSSFQQSRKTADYGSSPVYSIQDKPTVDDPNYAIAIGGIRDDDGETVPITVTTNPNAENPEIKDHSDNQPTPCALTLTITINKLTPGTNYNLYQYSSFDKVPTSSFNAHAADADSVKVVSISSGNSYTTTLDIQSDQIVVFRCVPQSAK